MQETAPKLNKTHIIDCSFLQQMDIPMEDVLQSFRKSMLPWKRHKLDIDAVPSIQKFTIVIKAVQKAIARNELSILCSAFIHQYRTRNLKSTVGYYCDNLNAHFANPADKLCAEQLEWVRLRQSNIQSAPVVNTLNICFEQENAELKAKVENDLKLRWFDYKDENGVLKIVTTDVKKLANMTRRIIVDSDYDTLNVVSTESGITIVQTQLSEVELKTRKIEKERRLKLAQRQKLTLKQKKDLFYKINHQRDLKK